MRLPDRDRAHRDALGFEPGSPMARIGVVEVHTLQHEAELRDVQSQTAQLRATVGELAARVVEHAELAAIVREVARSPIARAILPGLAARAAAAGR